MGHFRFMLCGEGEYRFHNGKERPAYPSCLVGPTFGPTRFSARGNVRLCGAVVFPAGWASLTGRLGAELADDILPAESLFGPTVQECWTALSEADTDAEQIRILDDYLVELFSKAPEPPFWFTSIVEEWLTSSTSPQVEELVAATGLSARQVERHSNRIYGGPPKLVARKHRALKAAAEVARHRASWHQIAQDSFFDQSHFIREFKRFVGVTPTQLLEDPSPFARLLLRHDPYFDRLGETL